MCLVVFFLLLHVWFKIFNISNNLVFYFGRLKFCKFLFIYCCWYSIEKNETGLFKVLVKCLFEKFKMCVYKQLFYIINLCLFTEKPQNSRHTYADQGWDSFVATILGTEVGKKE